MAVAEKVTVELELRDQQYVTRVKASEREFKRSMDATEKAAENTARDIERTMGQVPDSLRAKYRELGTDIGRSFAGASRAAQLAFGAITAYSLNAARKAEDINDAFTFTFNEISGQAEAAAERISTTFNRTSTSVKENLNNAYQILTGLGLSSAESFTAAQSLAERSIDLASQKGISDARSYEAIISGLTGETEPLKRLGVVLSEATVQAELLRLGFKGNAANATEAQKAVARLNLILGKTATAQGDVARTADSANNKLKAAQTEFENAAIALGNELLPALVGVTGAATDVLRAFNDLPGGVQVAGLAFLGLIAAGGPIAGLIANLARLRLIAIETKVALAAVAGGSVAGGAAAGGVAGLLARAAPTAALGAGLITGLGSFAPAPYRGSDQSRQLDQAIRDRDQARFLANDTFLKSATVVTQQRAALISAEARVVQVQRDIARRQSNSVTSPNVLAGLDAIAGVTTPTEVIGGFGLGGVGNSAGGAGGRGGGTARASAAADDLDRLRADLARVQDSQLTDAERAAKDLAEKIAIIERASQRGLITANEAAVLQGGVAGENLTRAPIPTLGPLGTEGQDIAKLLRDGQAELDKQFQEQGTLAATSFIDILRSGNIGQELGYRFADAAFNNLQQILSTIFSATLQNGGQGAGILKGIGSVLGFGGARAMGGPVRAGFAYDVGERGRERFVAPANGFIMPNMGAQTRSAPSASTVNVRQSFDLTGVSGDAAIYANVQQLIRQGQRQTLAIVKQTAPSAQLEQRLLRD